MNRQRVLVLLGELERLRSTLMANRTGKIKTRRILRTVNKIIQMVKV